jgi:hypothetical protein
LKINNCLSTPLEISQSISPVLAFDKEHNENDIF